MLLATTCISCGTTAENSSENEALASYNVASDPRGYVDSLKWTLIWNDEFDYADSQLENEWISDNGRYKSQIACTRFRENAVVENGCLKLINKREARDPRTEWTSGNIWTRQTYTYGYFECRYKYAAAYTTNNAFWLMPSPATEIPEEGIKFEIDVNEGHYPNELYLDLHNWTQPIEVDGVKKFPRDQRCYAYGTKPEVHIELLEPITTSQVRLSSNHKRAFTLNSFKILESKSGEDLISQLPTKLSVSGVYDGSSEHIGYGKDDGSSAWKAPLNGDKWIVAQFDNNKEISSISFDSGVFSEKSDMVITSITDYLIEYWDGTKWIEIESWDVADTTNFANTFHTYGLAWTKEELIYYFDGAEIRREPNLICHNPANVYLSMAILKYLGDIPDNVDGSFMEVDYVRIYKEKI